jgi:peptidoglycan L-alanyl-D-glutamate endopeptidase CwlK
MKTAWKLDHSSNDKLQGVHLALVGVVERAAREGAPRFRVIEGTRTLSRQRELVKRGASKTLNSRHLTGHAVDIVPLDPSGNVSWDWPLYYPLARAIKRAAEAEGVPIEWGGDWKKFKDGPHWQRPWASYPAKNIPPEAAKEKPITERKVTDLSRSRTVAGGAVSLVGGAAVAITETRTALEQASGPLSNGTILGIVIGVLIFAGAALAIYARWDDARGPKGGDE